MLLLIHIKKSSWGGASGYKQKAFGYEFNLNDDSSSLLYIPSGYDDPLVCWSTDCLDEGGADAAARADYILNHLYGTLGLEKYAGTIAPRGSLQFPYQSTLDLKIKQVLPGFRPDDEVIITLGIENLLNMLNDEWGVIEYGYYSGRIPVIDLKIVDGKYDFSDGECCNSGLGFGYDFEDPLNLTTSFTQSVWRAQLGFVYKF